MKKPQSKNEIFLILLLKSLRDIKKSLGKDWQSFLHGFIGPLVQLSSTNLAVQVVQLIDELIDVGLRSKAEDVFRKLLNEAQEQSELQTSGTRKDVEESWGDGSFSFGLPSDEDEPPTETRSADEAEISPATAAELAGKILNEIHGSPLEAAAPEPETRYLNTGFGRGGEVLPADAPLVSGQAYELMVEIHPERRWLNAEDLPFPANRLPENVLRVWAESGEKLPLTVWVASVDFKVVMPQILTLALPFEGPSEPLRWTVIPQRTDGRGDLQVEVFYKGNLLQSVQVSAEIIPAVGMAAGGGPRPAQSARVTFSAEERLDADSLNELPERVLTINVEQDQRDQSLNFRFLDRSGGDSSLAYYDTPLQAMALAEAVGRVRKHLGLLVETQPDGYMWILDGTMDRLNKWLPRLAEVGQGLYRKLFPPARGETSLALPPGTVIQVNPVLGQVTLPWGLLYERPVWLLPNSTRVCPEFRNHGPDDCPHASDPTVICPHAFWGYRYAIEQIPAWVSGELPQLPTLVRQVNNSRPLHLSLNVWRNFSLWKEHRQQLEAIPNLRVHLAEDLLTMRQVWQAEEADLGLVYFYCHGGVDDTIGPYLELSDNKFGSNILATMGVVWPRRPLVLLNGCATGAYGPECYMSLIDDFREMGASGVIGTESLVPEMFAKSFMSDLLPRLFRGERLGQALLEVRQRWLMEKLNPLGLLYALFATNEIRLAEPILEDGSQPAGNQP
jgi:hypothetical protein